MRVLLILLLASSAYAGGPIFRHQDGRVDQEFENAYKDIRQARKQADQGITDAATALNTIPTISAWASFTPTGAWTTNVTYTGQWRRVGDTMEVQFKILCSGAPDNVTPTLILPNSNTIDTAKVVGTTDGESPLNGIIQLVDSGVAYYTGRILYGSTSAVKFRSQDDGTAAVELDGIGGNTNPFTYGANDYIQGFFSVPISGWTTTN